MAWAKNNWIAGELITHTALNDIGNSIRTWEGTVNANGQNLAGAGTITCSVITATGTSRLGTSEFGNGFAEIGKYGSGNRVAYFDFHAADGADYHCRFLRDAGPNGDAIFSNAGTGKIRYSSAGGLQFENDMICTNLPTTAPPAGSKKLWADPADAYRIKIAF